MAFWPILLSVTITAQPLASGDALEPSVRNEVEHALAVAPTNVVPASAAAFEFARLYETNGLDTTAQAIALVSAQRDGRWFYRGTNVTPVAVMILRRLSGDGPWP